MPYTSKGKCVYKKGSGKKVGCTKGPVKKYLAALHANVKESKKPTFQRFYETVNGEIWTKAGPKTWVTELSDLEANGFPFPKEFNVLDKRVNMKLFSAVRTEDEDNEITHWVYRTKKGTEFIVYND